MALHACDNPPCVNPDHLFLGNHRDNMRDMVSKQRSAGDRGTWRGGVKSPERAHKARLNWNSVREIREKYATGDFSQAELASAYGVSEGAVFCVIHHRTWKTTSA
jgi:hypothetical protein